MTLPPSTLRRGVELWISSLRDTRASLSVTPGKNLESAILGISGRTSGCAAMAFVALWEKLRGESNEPDSDYNYRRSVKRGPVLSPERVADNAASTGNRGIGDVAPQGISYHKGSGKNISIKGKHVA
jgi:hypothetical protein